MASSFKTHPFKLGELLERIRGLIASVSRAIPVGALMTLETGGNVDFKPRPIESARRRIRVSVVSPQSTVAKHLKRAAETATILDITILANCRFPVPVVDAQGRPIYPPKSWQVEAGGSSTYDPGGKDAPWPDGPPSRNPEEAPSSPAIVRLPQ